jgi:exodeoxyribonuclease-5
MTITFTEDQSLALQKLETFLASDDPFFLLSGSAGVGKTFILSEVPKLVKYGGIVGCGPTHKSVKVLSERLPDVECCTIHRFLGLRPKRSKDKTILTKRNDYDPSANAHIRVVCLDEASMNGTDILGWVKKDAEEWDRKYILSGDMYQLNPVGELVTPCFNLDFGPHHAELKQIVRQAADNPIITAATAIRDAIAAGKEPPMKFGNNGEVGVYALRPNQWMDKLQQSVHNHDPDSFRVLAYRNDTVRHYNQVVREMLGYDTTVPFEAGEMVVVNEAYSQNDEIILTTGAEYEVEAMQPFTHNAYPDLEGYQVLLKDSEVVNVLDYVKSGEAYKARLAALKDSALINNDWRAYYRLSEEFADIRPLYGLTAHKSQGSTFDNVFVDFRDIYSNRVAAEADRCLYVAVTRARYNVYVLY